MSAPNAKFVWYELMTSDPKAAAAFYAKVVGWTSRDAGMPEPYTLMLVGDAQVAGMMALPAEQAATGRKPAWSGYVAVDDVDAMAARIVAADGKLLHPPEDIPGIGRFAVCADPQGATFMLFKPARNDPPPMPPSGAPGTTGWHELYATDWQAAFAFYSSLFGWTKGDAMDMGPGGVYQIFQIDGVPSGGMMTAPPESPNAGWGYYFNIDGIDAAIARITQAGGRVVNGPMEVPGPMWIVQGADPQGAGFALVSGKK
jgi:uncharacterized protein